ncbi:class I SAM-dependent methyltransferase [Halorubellus salinus]|uniref:class I SAM-dependent methyltransferase n=1 Tax=Halorubellus salinus TaxID=755309 RepID=UPI001D060069|nr:class I SAM-dependent methyltransferase [Halorubellus salinus]
MNDDARDALATVATLRAARETGALDALLDDADTPSDVAARTDLDARAASVLVDVLADRGFFDAVDGAYEPTNRALGLLTKTDLRSIGPTPREIDVFDAYAALPETLTDDDPVAAARDARSDDHERNRLGAHQATPDAAVSAAVSAAQRTAPTAATVVDVGGSPGQHATEFAARGHDVTLRDVPARIDAARPLLAPRDVELDPGALTDTLPATDLVFATDLTPRLDDPALEDFAGTAHDALVHTAGTEHPPHAPERALVLVEHLQDHSPRTPTHRLDALATGHPGDHRTEDALRTTLETAGFQRVDVHAIPGLDAHAVAATPRST